METIFDEQPEDIGLEICEICWEDEGFHFSWCPTQQDKYNETIDEEIIEMEEEFDDA